MTDYVWFEASTCPTEGKGWTDTERPYDRLPVHAQATIPPAVWDLNHYPAGLSFEFSTDAPEVVARWWLGSERIVSSNTTRFVQSGLDCYAKDGTGHWRWMGVGAETTLVPSSSHLALNLPPAMRQYRVYLPLFASVDRITIGLPPGYTLTPGVPQTDPPIVMYGTSIMMGFAASRPGRALPAIIGRTLNKPTLNLGFSGVGKMEQSMAYLIGEVPAAAYVIDCLPNMDKVLINSRAALFVRTLRLVRPSTPIILVEDRTYANAWARPDLATRNQESRAALRAAYETLQSEGVTDLAYVTGAELWGTDDDASVDGVHPSDLGLQRQADILAPLLGSLIS